MMSNKLLLNTQRYVGSLFTEYLQNIDDLFITRRVQYYYKCCKQATRKEVPAMVEVKYWETVTQRKKEEPLGIFRIDIVPEEIPEVSKKLKGKINRDGKDLYELAVVRRNKKIEKSILDCKFTALDKVREIVGHEGVLVANIIEEEK